MNNQCTKERFVKDTENHKMEILQNDGMRRHLRMSKGSSDGRYDILTWDGHLCITGDYGSYLFARTKDMFEFFRSKTGELIINPGYWAEKCLAQSCYGEGIKEFSIETFREKVIEHATSDAEEHEKQGILDEINELLFCENEYECIEAIENFDSDRIDFTDFWECDCKEYTFYFIWCLYAIVFAIQKFDEVELKS
jgi:hypothetical protein